MLVSQLNLLGELDNLLFISAVDGTLEAGTYFWKAEFELGFRLESSALLEDDFVPNNNSWNSKNIKKWVSQNLEFESRNLKHLPAFVKLQIDTDHILDCDHNAHLILWKNIIKAYFYKNINKEIYPWLDVKNRGVYLICLSF